MDAEVEAKKSAKASQTITWKMWETSDGKRKSCSYPGCKHSIVNVKTIATERPDGEPRRRRYMYCSEHTPEDALA